MSEAVWEKIARQLDRDPNRSPEEIAAAVYRALTASEGRDYLLAVLAEEVVSERGDRRRQREADERARVRAIEVAAERAAWEADEPRRLAERRDRLAERRAYQEQYPWTAPRHSRIYKTWAATPDGRLRIGDDAERQRKEDAERAEWRANPDGALRRKLDSIMESFRQDVRLELTVELLVASFALGDGEKVTWGEATVDDHAQRIDLLLRTVEGTSQTVMRHAAAIRLLEETGAATLAQVAAAELVDQ